MDMNEAVKEYLCPGCMKGISPKDCDSANIVARGCTEHYPGTMLGGAGTLALGFPKGFNRYGYNPITAIEVFQSYENLQALRPNLFTKFSLPIWKHLDRHGNTVMRWFSPRTNYGWSLVIIGDCRDRFPLAVEITQDDVDGMD